MNTHLHFHRIFVLLAITVSAVISAASSTQDCVPLASQYSPSRTVSLNCPATFAVRITGSAPDSYQWFRDSQPIPGATNAIYTIPHVTLADDGARFHVAATNPCSHVISLAGTLIVSLDVAPPRLLRARGDASLERFIVTFGAAACGGGPGLDPATAENPLNYSLSGGPVVSNAVLEPNGTNVILTTSRQAPNWYYTLIVQGVTDRNGNSVEGGSGAGIQSWVVVPGSDPPQVVPPPIFLSQSGSNIQIIWPYGSFLQESSDIRGPWRTLHDVGFPYAVTPAGGARFYRALFDP